MVQRIAVLVGAGVTPAAAWGYLGRDGEEVASAIAAGNDVPECIAGQSASPQAARAWSAVAVAWRVASEAGAPLAGTLREFAAALRTTEQIERNVWSSLAAPRATARLVLVLPVIGVLFGAVLGFDTMHVLFATGPGLICLVAGLGLVGMALAWNRRLLASARPTGHLAGLRCDLMAIALSGGASLDRAAATVDAAMERSPGAGALAERDRDARAVDAVLDLSRRAGVPAAELLRSAADEARRAAAAEAERRAAVLGVRLMLPLGVCILPAFMLLGVVPLLLAVVSSTLGPVLSQ